MSFIDFWRRQHTKLPVDLTPESCQGKTYIVTGANNGLGYECTLHLVRFGAARVIMAVRNVTAGEAARASIEATTHRTGVLDVWDVDLASYDSVKKFVKRVEAELDRVDAVVENAAVAMDRWVPQEGRELILTTNVFSTLLMAVLLVPMLKKTARRFGVTPRIAIVGSNAAFLIKESFDLLDEKNVFGDLNNREKWEPRIQDIYPLSKLVLLFAHRELAAHFPVSHTGVIINLSSPGLCYTGLTRNIALSSALPIHIMRMIMGRSAEVGSRTLLSGIAAGENSHGKYMSECKVDEEALPPWMTDKRGQKVQERIWAELAEILEGIQPGCLDAISKA